MPQRQHGNIPQLVSPPYRSFFSEEDRATAAVNMSRSHQKLLRLIIGPWGSWYRACGQTDRYTNTQTDMFTTILCTSPGCDIIGPIPWGHIAVPSVTRCRCRRRRCCCCGHRRAAARSGEWAQHFPNASCYVICRLYRRIWMKEFDVLLNNAWCSLYSLQNVIWSQTGN